MRQNALTHFAALFDYQMAVRGYETATLANDVRPPRNFDKRSFRYWRIGKTFPTQRLSLDVLSRVEEHLRLPSSYFSNAIVLRKSASRQIILKANASQQ